MDAQTRIAFQAIIFTIIVNAAGEDMALLDADEKFEHNQVGEDTWELFELIEQSFGVDLGNYYDLAGVSVGQLAEKISGLANFPVEDKCLSAGAFYKLRRAFEMLLNVPRTEIRPATPIARLLPWRSRRTQWRKLEDILELKIPTLMCPGWVLLLCLVTALSVPIFLRIFLSLRLSVLTILGASFVLFLLLLRVCRPFARSLAPKYQTVGGLAKAILARNYAAFAAKHGSSSERGVLPALRILVASGTGMEPEEITTKTRIPTDLNIY